MSARSGVVVPAFVVVVSATLAAQWPSYPTPDVPRDGKGQPVLTGAPPRMPDGKVDFSGRRDRSGV
jgi:hypothetical protein